MTLFIYIGNNIERLKKDVSIGLTSYCVIKHWSIYSRYLYYKGLKYGVAEAVICTSQDFKLGERTIYKIIKKMEAEI